MGSGYAATAGSAPSATRNVTKIVFVSTMTVPPPEKRRQRGTLAARALSRSTSSAAFPEMPKTMALADSTGITSPVSVLTQHASAPGLTSSHSFVISQLRLSARKSASSRRRALRIGTFRSRSRFAGGPALVANSRTCAARNRRCSLRNLMRLQLDAIATKVVAPVKCARGWL